MRACVRVCCIFCTLYPCVSRYDYDYIKNYKVLQNAFGKLKVSKVVPVDKLVRGKYQDNLEFMQWFKSFYDLNGGAAEDYDPVEARSRSKNPPKPNLDAPKHTPAPAVSASGATGGAGRPAKRTAARKPIAETTKENAAVRGAKKPAGTSRSAGTANAKLQETNEKLVRQVGCQ